MLSPIVQSEFQPSANADLKLPKLRTVNDFQQSQRPAPKGYDGLNGDDFLKILTVQLTHQDPLEPMKDTSFIAEMANFTSLERMNELSKNMALF
ncbi:MAG TPA: flagellar hook capping FlgD N-terminal domain-containing protein, partial [Opitutales bacterium]|nr:flagellar hook capping FlgD N-terminal domain-containing protein [Opitutales bacterium]